MQEENKENIVKRACKELGVTQKELAEMMGTHLNTVQKWATGEIPLSSQIYINVLLENKNLKERLKKFQMAFDLIDEARTT